MASLKIHQTYFFNLYMFWWETTGVTSKETTIRKEKVLHKYPRKLEFNGNWWAVSRSNDLQLGTCYYFLLTICQLLSTTCYCVLPSLPTFDLQLAATSRYLPPLCTYSLVLSLIYVTQVRHWFFWHHFHVVYVLLFDITCFVCVLHTSMIVYDGYHFGPLIHCHVTIIICDLWIGVYLLFDHVLPLDHAE